MGAVKGKTQWEVALELLLPPMLKRLDVLQRSHSMCQSQHTNR